MKSKNLRLIPLLIASGALSFAATTDGNQADTPNTFQLDQVSVKAKRIKEKPESPYAVTESSELQTQVITRKDLDALNPKTTWDILEQIPGFQVQETARMHPEWYYFQGTQSAFGVLVDGVYLTQLDRVISTLPPSAIESVTIVRDATALTLGPLTNFSAMASGGVGGSTGSGNQGFILIKTRRATKQEGEVSAQYGTYNAEKYGLSLGDKIGKFDYRISGQYNSDPGNPTWRMAQRSTSIFFTGGYTGETFEAKVLYAWEHGKKDGQYERVVYPTAVTGGYDYSKVGTMTKSNGGSPCFPRLDVEMAALDLTKHWSGTQTTSVNFGYGGNAITLYMNNAYSIQNSYSTTFSLRHVITSETNTFKAGFQRFSYLAPYTVGGGSQGRDDEKMNGAFVEDEHKFFNGKLSVDGGLRIDQKVFDTGWLKPAAGSQGATKISPALSLGASLKAIPRLTLTARVSHTENDPSAYQYLKTPGDTLHTEKRNKLELGALGNVHPAFNPFATAYVYNTHNQKGTTGTSQIINGIEYDQVTEQGVRTRGLDLGASGRIVAPLDYQFSCSVFSNDLTTTSPLAHHTGSASLRYHEGPFGANVNARYVGKINSASTVTLPGISPYPEGDYTRIDANLSYDFKLQGKDSKVMVYGRNITDKHYINMISGTNSGATATIDPGCTYGIQVSCKFF